MSNIPSFKRYDSEEERYAVHITFKKNDQEKELRFLRRALSQFDNLYPFEPIKIINEKRDFCDHLVCYYLETKHEKVLKKFMDDLEVFYPRTEYKNFLNDAFSSPAYEEWQKKLKEEAA